MKPIYVATSIGLFFLGLVVGGFVYRGRSTRDINSQSSQNLSGFSELLGQQSYSKATPTPRPVLQPLPQQKKLSGGRHVFQSFNNCGPSALSMALSHYGINQTQAVLGQSLRPWQNSIGDNDDKSVTLAEISLKAEEFGFIAYHRPAGSIEIVKQFLNYDIPVITRTLLTIDDDIGHYRVITGFDDLSGVFYQDDSLQGSQLTYKYQDYLDIWQSFNYEFLVLVPFDKVEKTEVILGAILDEEVAWRSALDLANKRLSQNPDDSYATFNKAVALYHIGEYRQSIAVYETVAASLPFRTLWYQLEPILAYYQVGDYDKVLALSNQILQKENKAYSELYQLQAQIYISRDQTNLAQEALTLVDKYGAEKKYWLENLD